MTLPIKVLPIVERWDCTGCGKCCRGNVVPLHDDDLTRLREQRWDQHPDYRGKRTIVRQGLIGGRYQLAQRDDGTCVFLSDEGLCRIHQEFGFEAKPLICRMYPLQLVPVHDTAHLTLRRSCPTAAADQGREMRAHRDVAKAFVRERPRLAESVPPPDIHRGHRRGWKETLLVMRGVERLLTDERFPLVRRIVHGLRYCDLLENCRLKKVDATKLRDLINILVDNAPAEAAVLFRQAAEPPRFSRVVFRQITAEYLTLQPGYIVRESWSQRLRMMSAAFGFARGRGSIPRLHESYPEARFEQIESRRLGHMDGDLQEPLVRYFAATAVSRQYAMAGRTGWSLIEKYRALAMAYPVAMWTLRYFGGDQPPTVQHVIDAITAIDRGQGFGPLGGRQHRRRIAQLTQADALDQLVIWYAR